MRYCYVVILLFPHKCAFFTYFAELSAALEIVPFEGQRYVINLLFQHRSEFRRRRRTNEIMIGKKGDGMQTRNIQFAIEFLRGTRKDEARPPHFLIFVLLYVSFVF